MDRTEGVRRSIAADDAFQQSLSRLSLHLATRRAPPPLPPPLPARRRSAGWPFMLLIAVAAAGAAGYHYAAFNDGGLMPNPRPRAAEAATAPTPALASVAIAPALASPVPPAVPVPEAAAVSPPAELALPAPLPAPPLDISAPRPEIGLSRDEVLEVQKRLASLGLNPGPIDGAVGPRTTVAAQRYEELRGRTATGKIDRGLLTLLRKDEASAFEAKAQ